MTHEQVVAEVIARARANPSQASLIFADASEYFNRLAEDPRRSEQAPLYQMMAKEFANQSGNRSMRRVTKNDFDEIADQQAQAYESAPGDDMEVEAQRRNIESANDAAGDDDTPSVSIAPKSIEGSRLGSAVTLQYGAIGSTSNVVTDIIDPATGLVTGQTVTQVQTANGIVQEATALLWQGEKKEAQAVTVDVGVLSAAAFQTATRPYGVVTYGSDGVTTSARFDIMSGSRFTVVGNYVSVVLGMDQFLQLNPQTGKNFDQGVMSFGASLGFFAAPSIAPVMSTIYVDDLAPGNSPMYPRPAKSVALLPPQSSTFGSNVTMFFMSSTGLTLYQLTFNVGNVIVPIPLSGDVAFIEIQNNDLANRSYRLPFQLAL